MRRARPDRDADGGRRQPQRNDDRPAAGTAGGSPHEASLAALHRAGGNQAVQSAVDDERVARSSIDSPSRSPGEGRETDRDTPETGTQTTDGGAGTRRNPESADRESAIKRAIQPKLEVSNPTDRYEREADRVAKAVMRNEAVDQPSSADGTPALQRMCSRCRERVQQGKPLDCEECEAELQRAADASGGRTINDESAVARQVRRARSGGRRLPRETRSYFESRMGQDFGDVRVHTGAQADRAARSVNARAFTLGSDVVFRSGEYSPDTRSGKRLLAHELTHVVQQGGGRELAQSSGGSSDVVSRSKAMISDIQRRDSERIQRLEYGVTWAVDSSAGPAPPKFSMVPEEDKDRVEPAVAILDRIVENENEYSECHKFFAKHCDDGNPKRLRKLHRDARLWKLPGAPRGTYGETDSSTSEDIAYTKWAYQVGRWTIASTILHEYTHTCGADHPHGPSTDENLGEQAVIACGLPPISEIE